MKTIVNKLRFALVLGFLVLAVTAWSQRANIEKMSISTQMFLDQIENKADFTPQVDLSKKAGPHTVAEGTEVERPFCNPDTINGKVYMSAFVRVSSDVVISQLEAMGVEIQSKFEGGLMTALIPIEEIENVAALVGVTRINAAMPMNKMTKVARTATNADDVLTQSADAVAAGLTKKFDGSGVILGMIDTGIDFNHIAFKDKNGNSRIKRAYVYNGSSAQEYTSITSSTLTDDNSEDHGTHTSSIAGGSSVIVSGSTVTVTDDHANATYGGMAPGVDLYLAGIKNLSDTYLANAVNKICTYADQQGKPLVVSNSWGSQLGPHDGSGDVADIYNSLFGDSHPNRVALFASSNDAGKGIDGDGGGYHISGTASSANPLGSILRCHYYSDTDDGYMYAGIIANAWSRAGTTTIKCRIHVLNKSTGAILTSVDVTPTTSGATVSGLSTYYSGTLYAFKDYISASGKTQIMLYSQNGLQTRSANNYVSNYTLAVEFYPQTGSATIDVWGGQRCYFTNYLSTADHTWQNGDDDMSVSDEATIANVISVGAYVSKNQITNYNNNTYNYPQYTIGDIAYFSSYGTADQSPTGLQYPWITAPGARLISAINHNHTASVDDYSYYGSNYNFDLVVNSSTNPYAAMEGTSMATPAAAGIVALWLQASLENNAQYKNLTVNDVKEIMRETAITDSYTTTGTNASHFGNGKIDALAGIQYILGLTGGTITVDPTELAFGGSDFWAGSSQSLTVVVTNTTDEALHLTIAGLNASLSGTPFSVTAITNNGNVAAGGGTVTITITYAPTAVSANDQATLTIAEGVTVALTGSCVQAPDPYAASVNPVEGTLPYGIVTTGTTVTKTITITNEGMNPFTPVVNVSAPFVASYDNSPLAPGQSRTITVTFTPDQAIVYSEQLTITAPESNVISFTYTLTGTGEDPYIAATVNPTTLDFTNKTLGQIYTNTVTITNTGTQVFTPVINTDNLPTVYTVDGNGQVAINSSINLTVSYAPNAVGTHNGSFTVTIGNETYTVNVYGSAVEVTEATVADGTTSNVYLPIYGNQYGNKQINQMIYPSSMLTEIQGKTITSMKFYSSTGINFSGGAFTVKMGTTTTSAFTSSSRYSRITSSMTTVKTGQVAVSGSNEFVITFDQPFEYTSGNLVIDFEVTTTGTGGGTTRFYGVNPGSYQSFYSYGTSTNSYGRYTTGGTRLQFLPKVTFEWETPHVAGTVTPNSLTFTDVAIGRSQEQTVTVTNTGTLPFTPVIDTTNLPAEFTVTGNGAVAVNGTLDLTVTYSPTDEGPHSGSFTVTIGDVTYTVTVTGNGIIVNSTLYSNEVMVKVFKSNLQANDAIAYSKTDIDNDTDHGLPTKNNSGDVIIQVLGDQDITSYELLRKQEGESTWRSVATANNSNNTYTQVNHADNTVTVADGATAWLALLDDAGITSTQVYYIPVTHALSTQQQDNTYGAQRQSASTTDVSALIYSKVMSSDYGNNEGHTWTVDDKVYTHYTILLDIDNLIIPTSEVDETQDYDLYKVRVWRQIDPAYLAEEIYTATNRLGYNRQERITGDFLMEEVNNDDNPVAALSLSGVHNGTNGNTGFSEYKLGSRDDLETFHSNWTQSGTDEVMGTFGAQKLREYDGETGVIEALPMTFIVRAYYTRTANLDLTAPNSNPNIGQAPRRDGEAADGNFYIVEYTLPFTLDANDSEIVTSVGSVFTERQVVGVTYVNALGQQSDKPFDGVNIVVTRYSDGSITTSKVLK